MDIHQVQKLLATISEAFPTLTITDKTAQLWHKHLARAHVDHAQQALNAYVARAESPHAPTISQFLGEVRTVESANKQAFGPENHKSMQGSEFAKQQVQQMRLKFPTLFNGGR